MISQLNDAKNLNGDSPLIDSLNLQLHSIFDGFSDMIFYLSVESNNRFKFHFLNKAFLKETGFSKDALLNRYAEEIIPPESHQFTLNKYKEAVVTKRPVTWQERILYPTGIKTGEVTVTPWFDDRGCCTHLIGCIKNISQPNILDAATNISSRENLFSDITKNDKSAQEITLLMNNIEESFVLVDKNLYIVVFNHQFQKHYKEYFGKDVKKADSILDYVDPTRRKLVENIYQKVFNGETLESETQVNLQDQPLITFLNRFKPAYEDGVIIGAFVTSTNISEGKNAAHQVQGLQRKMDAAIRVAKLGYWDWNIKEDKITWSDRIYEIYDLDKSTPLKLSTISHCVHPGDRKRYEEMLNNWKTERTGGSLEYRVVRNDGSIRYVQSEREAIIDEKGALIGFSGSILDITEKKLTENQIIREKELSDTLINSLPGVFYLYNKDGKFLRWNKNFEKVTGYHAEEIAKMHPLNFFDKTEKDLVNTKIKNVFIGTDETVEAGFLSKNQDKTPYHFTGNLITYEGEQCLIGVGFDISEKIKSHALLQKMNAHLVAAQKIARLGYWELNLQTQGSYWSDEMYKICGLKKRKSLTNIGTFINLVHPDDKVALLEANRIALVKNQVQTIEFRIIHKDNSIHHLVATINHIADDLGRPLRLEGTLQDITETKDYIREIENQNKTLREIAWMQSHTVRAPLARIMGLVNLLNLMKTHPCPEMSVEELANQIIICADELDLIIKKIVKKTEQVGNQTN